MFHDIGILKHGGIRRKRCGSNLMARLTSEQWERLKTKWVTGEYSNRELGEEFGVSHTAIKKKSVKEGWEIEEGKKRIKVAQSECGFIYVISVEDTSGKAFHKIGIAKHLETRIAGLQTSLPFDIVINISYYVDNMINEEKKLHAMYDGKRVRGEWFMLSNYDLEEISKRSFING